MTELPSGLTFGKVVGRFILTQPDSADPDGLPDVTPIIGQVKLLPRQGYQRVLSETPTTVLNRGILVDLNEDGRLVDSQGSEGVWLTTGLWDVTFLFKNGQHDPMTIEVKPSHAEGSPLDLTVEGPPPGTYLTLGQYGELSERLLVLELLLGMSGGLVGSSLVLDIDGVPYFGALGNSGGVLLDTDGVPYYVLGPEASPLQRDNDGVPYFELVVPPSYDEIRLDDIDGVPYIYAVLGDDFLVDTDGVVYFTGTGDEILLDTDNTPYFV